ncbi:MAG: ferritin-like domain-containing protein [Myxococcota bacterium]
MGNSNLAVSGRSVDSESGVHVRNAEALVAKVEDGVLVEDDIDDEVQAFRQGEWWRLRAVLNSPAVWAFAAFWLGALMLPVGRVPMVVCFASMTGFLLWGAIRLLIRHGLGAWSVLGSFSYLVMSAFGALITLFSTTGFSRGRQLRRWGKPLLAKVRPGTDWAPAVLTELKEKPAHDVKMPRAALAAQWRENGLTEHASVAAFARLTLDLMALGAPPALVADANRDALDEIRHTELCFSLARSLDGRNEEPGAFPEAQRVRSLPRSRRLALSKLAVDSLVEGALHEGVSARVIAKLARRCEDGPTRALLKELAADEGRHAAHGWDVVEWCVREGGRPVEAALLGALRVMPHEVHSSLPEGARDGSWERYGVHGEALEQAEYRAARAQLVKRVTQLCAASA